MVRKCSICKNYNIQEINRRLVFMPTTGETYKEIARDYENVSPEALRWHVRQGHVKVESGGKSGDCSDGQPVDDINPIDLGEMLPVIERESYEAYRKFMIAGDTVNAQKCLANAIKCTELRLKNQENNPPKKKDKLDYSVLTDNELETLYRLLNKVKGISNPDNLKFERQEVEADITGIVESIYD